MTLIGQQSRDRITHQYGEHVFSGRVKYFSQAGIDFIMGKREGIYTWDIDGARLINCHSNGGVFNLGHRNPRIIAAVERALKELDIGNHYFVNEARALLAARLAAITPGDLDRVVFGVSGGEAIDMAIKIARAHTGKSGVISAIGGYHGHTGLALAAGEESFRKPFGPLAPGFTQVPFAEIQSLEAALNEDTAAVIFETIPATFGIVIPPDDFYQQVRRLCDQHSVVMIIDEVQNGLGRCGTYWGIDHYDVVPDIMVTAKGLSGGIYPITATIYREHLNPFLHENPFIHISTYGGSEIGCHAAMEVLNILEEPGFLEHVNEMASIFKEGFEEFKNKYPAIVVEARQKGLMMGLKLSSEQLGPLMTRIGFEAGIFTIFANNDQSGVQVLPPLIIQEDEAQMILGLLDGMLSKVEEMVG